MGRGYRRYVRDTSGRSVDRQRVIYMVGQWVYDEGGCSRREPNFYVSLRKVAEAAERAYLASRGR
jgi:hypothetical protein